MKLHKFSLMAALALGSLLCFTQLSNAQDANKETAKKRPGMMGAEQRAEQMATRLELSAEQKTKVQAVFETEMKKMRELRADQTASREEMRPKMQALREETNKQLKTILTPAQFEKWEKMRQEFRQGGGRKAAGSEEKKADQKQEK